MAQTADDTRRSDRLTREEIDAWRGFLRVHADILRVLDGELESGHRLPLSSYEVLLHLDNSPEGKLRMRDLADAALLSRSGLTRLVDRLAKEGLVVRERCADDARGLEACITDRGRAKLAQARPDHLAGVRREFLDRLRPEDRVALAEIWERIRPGVLE